MPELPNDTSLLSELWNPAVNELPPIASAINSNIQPSDCLPINASVSPPVPLDLIPGEIPTVGIWVEPFIIGCNEFGLGDAELNMVLFWPSYLMNYDDGM